MKTTFFVPSISMDKPRFARDNLSSFEITGAHTIATTSYNCRSLKVPVLAYRGVEPLLQQFVDTTIKPDNIDPICYGLFKTKYRSNSIHASWIQNIHKNFYFELSSSLFYDTLSNITIKPTNQHGHPLSDEEISADPKINPYLTKLKAKLFDNPNHNFQNRNYVGPSYILLGYTQSFTNFDYLDFVDISLKTGCIIPISSLEKSNAHFSLFPHEDIINIGIPLQVDVAIGLYDWLNIGASGTIIGYIKNDQAVPLNTAAIANKLIVPTCGLCTVHHEPRITCSAYVEGEYLIPHVTWLVGISYVKQNKTSYLAADQQKFPTDTINNYPTHHAWEIAYITMSAEFDLSRHQHTAMPRCSLTYIIPVYGKSCFNSRMLAGQVGLEFQYDF